MKKNVGGLDRTLRLVGGAALLLAGLLAPLGAGGKIAAFAVAGIALLTAFTGF